MEIHTDHVARIIARANTVTERVQQRRGSKTRWIPEIAITPRRQGNFEGFEKMLKLLEIDIYRGEGSRGEGALICQRTSTTSESSTCFTS